MSFKGFYVDRFTCTDEGERKRQRQVKYYGEIERVLKGKATTMTQKSMDQKNRRFYERTRSNEDDSLKVANIKCYTRRVHSLWNFFSFINSSQMQFIRQM